MFSTQEHTKFVIGEGSINPYARIANGEISHDQLNALVTALQSDELYVDIDPEMIPNSCVDGRGDELVGPNAAGGTFSLVMGDALTTQSYRRPGEQAPVHARRMFGALARLDKKIGGHDDTHAQGDNCGCGADDKLDSEDPAVPSILEYITRRGEDIRTLLNGLNIQISDELHAKIMDNTQQLRDEHYATNGAELRQATIDEGGRVVTLPGKHVEAVLNVQTQAGKTLDRQKLHEMFDGALDAFNLDVPALQYGSTLLAVSETEAHERFVGALYYNVATAAALASELVVNVY
ncbi:MAG TPA: cadmium-containing carbonic anhydrase [Candidatus Microsaccharimonas sp.]|nr:cadmium-containing carbonic anhydrase [Candidatus Microsaccharimonas sp.]